MPVVSYNGQPGSLLNIRCVDTEMQNALVAILLDDIAHVAAGSKVAHVAKHKGA
jgi:hypothetical protein